MKVKIERSDTAELESLMREFPDWKNDFPDLAQSVYPERHYKAKKLKHGGAERVIQKRSTTVPVSDYQDTFRLHRPRPRSTKRPPPTPRDMNPPPMNFSTNQRAEFTHKDLGVRPQPIMKEDNYVRPEGKFADSTMYRQDYRGDYKLPEVPVLPRIPDRSVRQSGKFDGKTTTKEHYREWVPQPAFTFSELPCFTGSILYPDKEKMPESTTRGTFKGTFAPRADMVEVSEGNIRPEGDIDLETTHRLTYQNFPDARPAEPVVYHPKVAVSKRGKVSGVTQNRSDFPGYQHGQPAPPRPITPPPATIDLKFDNRTSFDTEQRRSYQGVDAARHPPPPPCKKEPEMYQPPSVKFEAVSQVQHDFKPFNIKDYKPPAKIQQTARKSSLPKFTSISTNSHDYRKYDVKPRVKYGDPNEGYTYVPPTEKFDAKTTTNDTYVGVMAEIPRSFKPLDKPVDQTGSQDFRTIHRTTYAHPAAQNQLSKQQRKALLNHLRDRKNQAQGGQSLGVMNGHAIAAT